MSELFDARRALLIDGTRQPCDWRLVSLVSALRAVLQPPDPRLLGDARPRLAAMEGILNELERRGIDGENLVRLGFGPEILWSVVFLLLPQWLSQTHPDVPAPEWSVPDSGALHDRIEAWSTFTPEVPSCPSIPIDVLDERSLVVELREFVGSVTFRVLPWILAAPIHDLLSLTPPTDGVLPTEPNYVPEETLLEEYRWLADRFSVTRLQEWSTSSLHREFLWLDGQHPAPCAETSMADREVPRDELAAEIARRATQPSPMDEFLGGLEFGGGLAARMQEQATHLLKDRRFHEAATLFEFALNENPNDANAANNLGFCLIPTDPSSALQHLNRAAGLRYSQPLINLHNRAVCHARMGEFTTALKLIEEGRGRDPHPNTLATLWVLSADGELALGEHANLGIEIAALARHCALTLGRLNDASRWEDEVASATDSAGQESVDPQLGGRSTGHIPEPYDDAGDNPES